MPFSVHQHWDPLTHCLLGKSYPPEFYSFIENKRVRAVMEQIAQETEEDYLAMEKLLKSFNVEVYRPEIHPDREFYLREDWDTKLLRYSRPPMTPRDYSIALGNDFYFMNYACQTKHLYMFFQKHPEQWPLHRKVGWPATSPSVDFFDNLPDNELDNLISKFDWIAEANPEYKDHYRFDKSLGEVFRHGWSNVLDKISNNANVITGNKRSLAAQLNSAAITRVGKDVYVGSYNPEVSAAKQVTALSKLYPNKRFRTVDVNGHSDGTFCPVVPGLILSLEDAPAYHETFPDWEVVYLPGESWTKVGDFLQLKEKNGGKWWVPGEELNDSFTEFVESWLNHWVGYAEESVFDVNILVIDEKNAMVNSYNERVFRALERYGVTPHVVNFRHRYFWDGGLHCNTSDLSRVGEMKDYFPDRK